MSIGAYLPAGSSIAINADAGTNATDQGINGSVNTHSVTTTASLNVGDWAIVFQAGEGVDLGDGSISPITIPGIDSDTGGGLHPTGSSHNIFNITGGTPGSTLLDDYTANNSVTRWVDLGYTVGGYNVQAVLGRDHAGVWAKILTAEDILDASVFTGVTFLAQISVDTINSTNSRNVQTRLVIVTGADTGADAMTITQNIATSSMRNTRASSATRVQGVNAQMEWVYPRDVGDSGYSQTALGDNFLQMFYVAIPPEGNHPTPSLAIDGVGSTVSTKPSADNNITSSTDGPTGAVFDYLGAEHSMSLYWERQTSFTEFDIEWNGDGSSTPNQFAWDLNGPEDNEIWAYLSHSIMIKEAAAAEPGGDKLFTGTSIGVADSQGILSVLTDVRGSIVSDSVISSNAGVVTDVRGAIQSDAVASSDVQVARQLAASIVTEGIAASNISVVTDLKASISLPAVTESSISVTTDLTASISTTAVTTSTLSVVTDLVATTTSTSVTTSTLSVVTDLVATTTSTSVTTSALSVVTDLVATTTSTSVTTSALSVVTDLRGSIITEGTTVSATLVDTTLVADTP